MPDTDHVLAMTTARSIDGEYTNDHAGGSYDSRSCHMAVGLQGGVI